MYSFFQGVRSIFLTLIVLTIFFPGNIFAQENENNIFGIHIMNEGDLEDAARLVNSNGGEWGYVTIVISDSDRDRQKWQRVFDKMRELKLIPIVRLATSPTGAVWEKPTLEDAVTWVEFLSSLNWVVKDRYITLFNEPNHAREWGNLVNPQEYALVARTFQQKLKESSADFYILPAGFDTSAPNTRETMDATRFWERMAASDPTIFTIFDGWSSHSYPNPAFSASPNQTGKGSVRSFAWEVDYLGQYGLKQNIPVFITETGWVHKEGKTDKVLGYNSETVGKFFQDAYKNVWSDKRVKAVTPFILNYPEAPFDYFSWKAQTGEFYPQFAMVQELPKVKGMPEQIHNSELLESDIDKKLITGSLYKIRLKFKNTGQSIWSEVDGFSPFVTINSEEARVDSFYIKRAHPGEGSSVELDFLTPDKAGIYEISVQMQYREKLFGARFSNSVEVIAPPKLVVAARSFFKSVDGDDLKLLIYENNEVVKEYTNMTLKKGKGEISALHDVSPGKTYRFVFIKPYHLPVETTGVLDENETLVNFPLMLPLDRNNDGKASWSDFIIWSF